MTEVKQKVFHPLTGQEVWVTPAEKGRLFTSLQKATEQEPATMQHSQAASAGMVSRLSASQEDLHTTTITKMSILTLHLWEIWRFCTLFLGGKTDIIHPTAQLYWDHYKPL